MSDTSVPVESTPAPVAPEPTAVPVDPARDEAVALSLYPWPEDIATLLRDPPRYGQGLLPWIKLMAIRMLGTGADPKIMHARST